MEEEPGPGWIAMLDMTNYKILKFALVGAVTAGVGWIIIKIFSRKSKGYSEELSPMAKLALQLESVKTAVSQAHLELKDGWDETLAKASEDLKNGMDSFMKGLKDTVISEDMQEAIEAITVLLDNLYTFDMDAVSYKTQVFLLLALLKKIQEETDRSLSPAPKDPSLPQEKLDQVRRFGMFALNCYPATWKFSTSSIAKLVNIPEEDIVFTWFADDENGHCPKFLLFFDHASKSLVMAIRGTFCLKDVILDIVCGETPFLDGFAHKGILDGATKILEKTKDLIEDSLSSHVGYNFVVTGHSLGAGTAELITMELLLGPSSSIIPKTTTVRCIALAPPPVYRPASNLPPTITSAIEIFINNNDIVPRLSLATLASLLAMLRAVDDLDLSITEQFSILANASGKEVEDNIDKVRWAVKKASQETFPFLEHPGRIYHMVRSKQDSGRVYIAKKTGKLFSRSICLFENMVMDHLHGKYEVTFNELGEQEETE